MILGNSKKFKGIGYVCYLDMLGFSDDILKNWNNQTSNPLEKILTIKREIPVLNEVEEDNGQENHRRYMCHVATVSDSIIICFGFNDEIIIGDILLGLEAVIGNIACIWPTSIMNGYTLRGAIDFGKVYWDENDIIGPAFIKAYQLESKVAKNSRIIISSDLNRVLYNLVKKYEIDPTFHLFKYFRKDVDGYIIVDPNIIYESDSDRFELIEELKKTRDAITSNDIVKEKYNPLISMLSEGTKIGLKDSDFGSY